MALHYSKHHIINDYESENHLDSSQWQFIAVDFIFPPPTSLFFFLLWSLIHMLIKCSLTFRQTRDREAEIPQHQSPAPIPLGIYVHFHVGS